MKKSAVIRPFLCDIATNSYGPKFNDILLSVMACQPQTIEEIQAGIIQYYPYQDLSNANLFEKVKLFQSLTTM